MKSIKIFLLALISTIFITTTFAARSYNVPQYDSTTASPGSGSGFSAPVTKFDVFSSDETDEVNYANTKVINITASEEKTFTLDFFTIEWYGSYPTQELVFDIKNKEIADITYYKNQVESGTIDDLNTNKTITDSELPDKLSGSYINTEYPALEFKLTGLVEGVTSLDITVNSTHSYGLDTNTSETLTILINVSATELIEIPNYIYLMLGTGIHSGVSDIKYIENERIGILTDVVSSLKFVLPTEITEYNSSSTNQILYRIKGDSSIVVSGDYISFNNVTSGKTSIFSVEYYILDSNNNEIVLNSYSFSFIFYSNSDITIGYNYKELPTDDTYEIGTPITVETTTSLKPYIEDLVVAHISGDNSYLAYENGYPYVIKEVTEDTYVEIVDKLLYLSGISGYINVSENGKYASFNFTTSNVIEKTYPTEIILDSNYTFNIDNSLSEYIDISNISSFSNATTFNVTSYGAISAEFTTDRRILLTYNSEKSITTTVSCTIGIEATLDNNTVLTKSISIHLTPINGYKYTFDKLSVSVLVGSSETITLGYLDPTFVEAKENVIENYYLKTGNAIVSFDDLSGGVDEVLSIKYKITGNNVGYDTAYFVVNGQIIEVSIVINEITENETISFEFNEGIYISVLTTSESEYSVSVPNEYTSYLFTFIVFDKTIASLENVKNSSVTIKGLKDGTTQLAAYTTVDNKTYNAIITIRVITSIPEVTLVTDKDASTTLTKYDLINVSFDASSFEFSKNTTYKWYLNNVLIEDGVTSINKTFDVGTNNIKLVINDIDNNIEIEATKEITILEGVNSPEIVSFDLNEGKYLAVDTTKELTYTISVPNVLSNNLFTFIVHDETILTLTDIKNNMATINGIKDGTTQITVTANIDNKIYSSIITIRVITSIPEVTLVTDKDANTTLTKYDLINVSFDALSFEFSKNTTYKWYLNNVLIEENVTSINKTFDVGTNNIKLVINDIDNNIEIEATKEITILEGVNSPEIVSFDLNEGKYLAVDTTKELTYTISVPNVLSNNLFTFIVHDETILTLTDIKNNMATINGIKDGTTQITVIANIDNKIYSSMITIRVITSIPEVTLVTDKDANTTLTKYDLINVSFDALSFEFSKNTTYKWYLNTELIVENVISFNKTFDEGTNTLKLVITDNDNNIRIEATKEIVISTEINVPEVISFSLNEGNNLSILANNEYTISVPSHLSSYLFTFIVHDETIVSLNNIKNSKATINGLKDGTTQITVTANIDNKIYSAIINIRVITSIPTVNIVVDKNDSLTSFTKYDTISVSFDASGFEFSKNTTYKWYLNDELIMENVTSFDRTFNEGLNNLKLVINDIENNLTIVSYQELMISSVENVQKTISINTPDVIYVDLHQGSFEIEALLDGVVNPNYKYIWSISNQAVCKITVNGNEKIILEPVYVGEVDLTVMTNISKYEEVYIKSEIKINVIEPTYKIDGNNFIKPGSNQTFKLLGNGYEIYNTKPTIKITVDGTEFTDYEVNNNEIIINEIPKGKYEISAELNGSKNLLKFESTNFNIKEIAKVTIPYLIVLCGIVLIVAFAVKKRKTKLERALNKITKLDDLITNTLLKEECTKNDLKQILKKTNKVKKILVYCIDEGIDELKTLTPNIDTLIKILVSALASDIDNNKVKLIIKNIKVRNVSKIINEFMIIKDERDAFESKKKVVDEIVDKKGKKVKVSKEEYELYLAQSKYAEDDDDEN